MPDIEEYVRLFEAGEYHAAHDALEPRWIRTHSEALRGLIQMAVGYHHRSRGNLHGARVLWTKALANMEAAGGADEGVDLESLGAHLREELEQLPPGRRGDAGMAGGLRPPAIRLKG